MDAIFGDIPVTFVLVIHQRGSRRDRFIGLSLTNNSIDPFGSYSGIHFGMKNKTQYRKACAAYFESWQDMLEKWRVVSIL